jgi:hypothetical protein
MPTRKKKGKTNVATRRNPIASSSSSSSRPQPNPPTPTPTSTSSSSSSSSSSLPDLQIARRSQRIIDQYQKEKEERRKWGDDSDEDDDSDDDDDDEDEPQNNRMQLRGPQLNLTLSKLNEVSESQIYSKKDIESLLIKKINIGDNQHSLYYALSQALAGDVTMTEEIEKTIQEYRKNFHKIPQNNQNTIEKKIHDSMDDLVLIASHIYKINIFLFKKIADPYKVNNHNIVTYILLDERQKRYDLLNVKERPHDIEESFLIEKIIKHEGNNLNGARYLVKFIGYEVAEYVDWNEIINTPFLLIYLKTLHNNDQAKKLIKQFENQDKREKKAKKKQNQNILDEPTGIADINRFASNKFTRKRNVKKLTGRKYGIFRDDYGLKNAGGCYCFMPYDKVDDNNRCLFKIGMTLDFTKRIEEFHTYFPEGIYSVAFLVDPTVEDWNNAEKTQWYAKKKKNENMTLAKAMKTKAYKEIESFLFEQVQSQPSAIRLYSTTRVKDPHPTTKKGITEWVYTDCDTIHAAFDVAHAKYPGGELMKFYFKGIDPVTGKIIKSINDVADEKRKSGTVFTGQITHVLINKEEEKKEVEEEEEITPLIEEESGDY